MHKVLFSLFDGKITIYTYSVCIVIGLLAGAIVFRWLCKRLKMSDKSYDYYSFLAIFTVVVGFIAAYVFQDIYNVLAGRGSNIVKDFQDLFAGKGFKMSGGITFMGGLLGGAVFFVVCVLLHKDKSVRKDFPLVADIAAPVILIAHGFGRIGCFFGGCCYGKVTDSIFGINYPVNGVWQPRYPTQLYEAAFCFIAFGIMVFLILKTEKRGLLIALYAASYSVFRFLVEFLRDDYRGGADIGLSPSQVQSIVLIILAAVYVCLKIFWWDRRTEKAALAEGASAEPNAGDRNATAEGDTKGSAATAKPVNDGTKGSAATAKPVNDGKLNDKNKDDTAGSNAQS